MYHGYDIVSSAAFRVTRNSNLYLAEEESRSLLESVRTELHNRRKGDAVRLEIEADADPEIIERLKTVFALEAWQVFPVKGPVNLSRLFNIYEQTQRPDLKYRSFAPRELRLTAKSKDLFEELRGHDILLHHPYDSYDAVISFIESAAADDRVLSVKQTLYRTNEHPLGAGAGRCGRPGIPRTGRPEDPLQAFIAGAPRSRWRDSQLCAHWYGKLQCDHSPHLHRSELVHGRS